MSARRAQKGRADKMSPAVRVEREGGPPVTVLAGGSQITDDESPEDLLQVVIARLRESNRTDPARPKSRAITQIQDAQLWLRAYKEGLIR